MRIIQKWGVSSYPVFLQNLCKKLNIIFVFSFRIDFGASLVSLLRECAGMLARRLTSPKIYAKSIIFYFLHRFWSLVSNASNKNCCYSQYPRRQIQVSRLLGSGSQEQERRSWELGSEQEQECRSRRLVTLIHWLLVAAPSCYYYRVCTTSCYCQLLARQFVSSPRQQVVLKSLLLPSTFYLPSIQY